MIRKFVERWCQQCDVCASRKAPRWKPKAPMCQYQVDAPLECVAIDIMGPLPTSASGNKYLLVDRLVTLFGVPRQFHTHQGANFEELA